MADMEYSIKSFENLGFKLKFAGYNDKLPYFIDIFLDMVLRISESGVEEYYLNNAIERYIKSCQNCNVEVDNRCSNNRLIYLMEHEYHANVIL